MSKLRTLLLGLASITGAFSLAACSVERTPEEQAAHTSRVSEIADLNRERCAINSADQGYHDRLVRVLRDQPTETLQALAARNIAICLDQRMINQQGSGRRIEMVYYGAARVISIPDNGAAYAPDDWSQSNPAFNVRTTLINRLLDRLDRGEVAADETSYGTSRKPHKRSRRYYWDNIKEMNADRLRQNPWLQQAPIRPQTAPARPAAPAAT